MHLAPRDVDKLIVHQVGALAQKRLARGLALNVPETVGLLAAVLLELIRDGKSVVELMELGRRILGRAQVLPGVPAIVREVQVEGTFEDGTKLVTVHDPICLDHGDLELALHGSFLPVPPLARFTVPAAGEAPGAVEVTAGAIELNVGRATVEVDVVNRGDRPIQVGSHYPFALTNTALDFDRAAADGKRLDIPAGTAVRFEPGDARRVRLVAVFGAELE